MENSKIYGAMIGETGSPYPAELRVKYIVEFENGGKPWWLADWNGDPGRTVVRENAKKFNSKMEAKKALTKAIEENPHRKMEGVIVPF